MQIIIKDENPELNVYTLFNDLQHIPADEEAFTVGWNLLEGMAASPGGHLDPDTLLGLLAACLRASRHSFAGAREKYLAQSQEYKEEYCFEDHLEKTAYRTYRDTLKAARLAYQREHADQSDPAQFVMYVAGCLAGYGLPVFARHLTPYRDALDRYRRGSGQETKMFRNGYRMGLAADRQAEQAFKHPADTGKTN
ncbi:hypothetical protein [Gloeobacter morelensis]|uniref:hypothetical protein n=1 Tax=Gloeobacter morelensis TaxID=2907343 RepID=UPI001E3AF64B|nr:hypothetical protein [Gloeobacter morelensis]UFP97260.1 hypothetical protein ISF26_24370 [Gloeobacter morelensis MG652769]